MAANQFAKAFKMVLEADEADLGPTPETPNTDRDAMASTLNTSKPEDFDVQVSKRVQQVDQEKINQLHTLKDWVTKLDEFIVFLNGTSGESIQAQLHSAPCDTVFEEIARSERKKISRLAAELSTLSESFKGYLISSND